MYFSPPEFPLPRALICKDFLQNVLDEENGKPLTSQMTSYSVNHIPGDNYTSLIYTIDTELRIDKTTYEKRNLVMKCYHNDPQRQEFSNGANLFFKELEMYSKWIPELRRFQTEVLSLKEGEVVPLPYVHFLFGESIDYESDEGKYEVGKVFRPLDNYIILENMKKKGFVGKDRRESLDMDHMRLVIEALATVHALSWAYRKNVESDLVGKFPCLKARYEEVVVLWNQGFCGNLDKHKEMFDQEFGADNELSKAAEKFKGFKDIICDFFLGKVDGSVFENLLRVKPNSSEFGKDAANPEQWRIICQGDCNSSNFLFRHDPTTTSKPIDVVLLDLQIVQETCVVNDLQYAIYANTDGSLRKNHLQELLLLYHDKFNQICANLKTPTLPGFTLESLKFRFHRAKFFGHYMAIISLPLDTGKERFVQLMQDMLEDGVL